MLVFVKVPSFLDRGLRFEEDPFPGPDGGLIPIEGSPLYESIQREFDVHLGPPIMSCIADERDAAPDLKGMLEITFVIAADGSIPGPVELDASWGAASEGLISCIRGAVEVYVFSEGSLTIMKPYRLE